MLDATSSNSLPMAPGVGYKPQHFSDILEDAGPVRWLEIHAENYMGAGGRPIAQLRHPDSFLRLVRGHPHELSRVDDAGEVVPDNVRHHRPDPSKRPVVVGGTGVACKRRGEEGLAISANERHERAVIQHREHGPRFG